MPHVFSGEAFFAIISTPMTPNIIKSVIFTSCLLWLLDSRRSPYLHFFPAFITLWVSLEHIGTKHEADTTPETTAYPDHLVHPLERILNFISPRLASRVVLPFARIVFLRIPLFVLPPELLFFLIRSFLFVFV